MFVNNRVRYNRVSLYICNTRYLLPMNEFSQKYWYIFKRGKNSLSNLSYLQLFTAYFFVWYVLRKRAKTCLFFELCFNVDFKLKIRSDFESVITYILQNFICSKGPFPFKPRVLCCHNFNWSVTFFLDWLIYYLLHDTVLLTPLPFTFCSLCKTFFASVTPPFFSLLFCKRFCQKCLSDFSFFQKIFFVCGEIGVNFINILAQIANALIVILWR